MAWIVTAIATGLGVSTAAAAGVALGTAALGLSAYQTYQAKEAGDAAEDAARAQADRDKKVQQKANERLLSTARARAAASGTSGLSESIFLADLKKQGLEELDWLDTAGESSISAAENRTDLAVTQGMQNVVGSFGTLNTSISEL